VATKVLNITLSIILLETHKKNSCGCILSEDSKLASINNQTQLNTFELIRDALLANSTISAKFTTNDIYQYEPKHKSADFRRFPYIWVNLPSTETDPLVLDHSTTLKNLTGNIFLRVEYLARDKFRNFANAIIFAIEAYEDTFKASGYYTPLINLIDTDPNAVIDQKELVEGTFELSHQGAVAR